MYCAKSRTRAVGGAWGTTRRAKQEQVVMKRELVVFDVMLAFVAVEADLRDTGTECDSDDKSESGTTIQIRIDMYPVIRKASLPTATFFRKSIARSGVHSNPKAGYRALREAPLFHKRVIEVIQICVYDLLGRRLFPDPG